MARYLISRLVSLSLSLILASGLIFVMLSVLPGDPAAFMLGLNATPEAVANLRAELGLEGGTLQRYLDWVSGMLRGDFGTSYSYRIPAGQLILDRLQVSLPLTLYALAISTAIAVPVGALAASTRGSGLDFGIMGAIQLGIAIPNFWFGILLVMLFALVLGVFDTGGFPGWEEGVWTNIRALTLPAVTLALPQASILARVMRSALLDQLDQDYIRTARAKGLSRGGATIKHGLRNALIPVLTIIGLQFSLPYGGRHHHRGGLLPARPRAADLPVHPGPRDLIVVNRAVMLLVAARDRGDLPGRPRLCAGRSAAAAARMSRNLILGGALTGSFWAPRCSLLWTPHDVEVMTSPPASSRRPGHLLGTDHFGRDILDAHGRRPHLDRRGAGGRGDRHGLRRAAGPCRRGHARRVAGRGDHARQRSDLRLSQSLSSRS